jgi:hypothetical protein
MKVERWKTTPFYQLVFSDQRSAERATDKGPYTVTVSYSRRFDEDDDPRLNSENEGILRVVDVVDREGASVPKSDLVLSLKSLWDESHWLDTGLFEIN